MEKSTLSFFNISIVVLRSPQNLLLRMCVHAIQEVKYNVGVFIYIVLFIL